MKLAQHQVQEVPGVDLSSCNSFFAQAVVTVTAGTSSLPSSPKTVSIVVAFRGTASVTLLSECLSRDCSRPSLSLFSPALMLCSEVKNMLTDVRISLQPLAEESKTGPFGLCEGPSECFDLEPKVPGSLWFCSAFFKSSSSSPSSTVLLVFVVIVVNVLHQRCTLDLYHLRASIIVSYPRASVSALTWRCWIYATFQPKRGQTRSLLLLELLYNGCTCISLSSMTSVFALKPKD